MVVGAGAFALEDGTAGFPEEERLMIVQKILRESDIVQHVPDWFVLASS